MSKTKYHPILFSTPMVQAILEGRKTQTRRVVKDEMLQKATPEDDIEFLLLTIIYKYKVGDVLWLRETFYANTSEQLQGTFYYKASTDIGWKFKWKPSIFMPKEACRAYLKIKAIRVERLQDISEEDSIAEGVIKEKNGQWKNYLVPQTFWTYAKYSFETLWISINGKESMNKNPFVWVYEFETIDKPLDFK